MHHGDGEQNVRDYRLAVVNQALVFDIKNKFHRHKVLESLDFDFLAITIGYSCVKNLLQVVSILYLAKQNEREDCP